MSTCFLLFIFFLLLKPWKSHRVSALSFILCTENLNSFLTRVRKLFAEIRYILNFCHLQWNHPSRLQNHNSFIIVKFAKSHVRDHKPTKNIWKAKNTRKRPLWPRPLQATLVGVQLTLLRLKLGKNMKVQLFWEVHKNLNLLWHLDVKVSRVLLLVYLVYDYVLKVR